MGIALMRMRMPVESEWTHRPEQHICTEEDENYRDCHLEHPSQFRRDSELKGDDGNPCRKERHRVSGPPTGPQHAGERQAVMPTDQSRHRREVISIQGMPEAEQEP